MLMKKQLIGFLLFSGMLPGTTTGFAQSGNVVKYRATMKGRYAVQQSRRWVSRADVRWGRFCSTAPAGTPTPPFIHFRLGRPLCGGECRAEVRWVRRSFQISASSIKMML